MTPHQSADVCEYHETNTTLLASVDAKLGLLIKLLAASIILWFPVVVTAVISGFSMQSRITSVEKDVTALMQVHKVVK